DPGGGAGAVGGAAVQCQLAEPGRRRRRHGRWQPVLPVPAPHAVTVDHERFDAITADELRASGALKWSAFPDCIGAFVAEMDFGIAPEIAAAVREALERGQVGYLDDGLVAGLASACSDWHATQYGWAPD